MRQAAAFAIALLPCIAAAQVICTMPNGVATELKLSNICPAGTVKAETPDGKPAPIRGTYSDNTQKKPQAKPTGPVVNADDFGADWPLTVSKGTLRCAFPNPASRELNALLIETGGKTYTLNGTAKNYAAKNGWEDVRAIWRNNPSIPGTKVPITPLIEQASALCKSTPTEAPAISAQEAEKEFIQARQLCAVVESTGAARCTTKTSLFTTHEFIIKAVGTHNDFVSLCDSMKDAAKTKFTAVRNSSRGWRAKIEHGVNSAIAYSCLI